MDRGGSGTVDVILGALEAEVWRCEKMLGAPH